MKHKGLKYGKNFDRTCGTCNKQGAFRICTKHHVKTKDTQEACNNHKYR